MKLYYLSFICGQCDTVSQYHLGTYSSEEKREQAIQQYRESYNKSGQPSFIGYEEIEDDGEFHKWESELDENIYQLQLE